MDLVEALRSTPASRAFTGTPVSDETVHAILDDARFAPSGGNRQAWRVVLVKDPSARRALRDLYLPGWYDYLAMTAAGMTPFASTNDRSGEEAARALAPEFARHAEQQPGFAETIDEVPALLLVLADLSLLATVDRDLPRIGLAGGASVYPFVWSILLAARSRGLGGVITTMAVAAEPEVLSLVGAGPGTALCALVALGEPAERITRLTRAPVEAFATVDRVDGPALEV